MVSSQWKNWNFSKDWWAARHSVTRLECATWRAAFNPRPLVCSVWHSIVARFELKFNFSRLSYPEPAHSIHYLLGTLYIAFFFVAIIGNGLVLWVFTSYVASSFIFTAYEIPINQLTSHHDQYPQSKISSHAIKCVCDKFGILWLFDDDKNANIHLQLVQPWLRARFARMPSVCVDGLIERNWCWNYKRVHRIRQVWLCAWHFRWRRTQKFMLQSNQIQSHCHTDIMSFRTLWREN